MYEESPVFGPIVEKYSKRASDHLDGNYTGNSWRGAEDEREHLRRRKEPEWEPSEPESVCVFAQRGSQCESEQIP